MNQDPSKSGINDEKASYIIEEQQQGSTFRSSENDSLKYDFVLAEASAGNYEGIPFTVSGLTLEEEEGQMVWTAYLDINKTRFVDFIEGTAFEFAEDVTLKVVKIEKADHDAKGKIYFLRL